MAYIRGNYLIETFMPLTEDQYNILNQFIDIDYNVSLKDFIAPYKNYLTTYSTTIIRILEKCGIKMGLIRIEPIYSPDSKFDNQIYRRYDDIDEYNRDIEINNEFEMVGVEPANTLFDWVDWEQTNSEHSRHWTFRTPIHILGDKSLMSLIKSTLNPSNSLIAFCDNSSAIRAPYFNQILRETKQFYHPCLTAETHNYPTYYHPYEGANTGVGGRIRDNLGTGCGSITGGGYVGYSVNSHHLLRIASDGCSNYANKVGEPLLGGYVRFHDRFEKPILYSCGVGWIKDSHVSVPEVCKGDLIVKIGSPAMKIGYGGSLASSIDNIMNDNRAISSVQRGDPLEGNKLIRLCERLASKTFPLIKKIHDQGAGGLGNVVKELVEPWDCYINLKDLPRVGKMSPAEIWLSEYQEQMAFICSADNYNEILRLCNIEGVMIYVLGVIQSERNSIMTIKHDWGEYKWNYTYLSKHSDLQLTNNLLAKSEGLYFPDNDLEYEESIYERALKIYLTTKIDRCVGGCVVQQSHIGEYSIPMSNYGIIRANSISLEGGCLSAIGENIYLGQGTRMFINKCICELIANLLGCPGWSASLTKMSGNWMWYIKDAYHNNLLLSCVKELTIRLSILGFSIDGGKDSLSMSMDTPNGRIISPPSLVLTSYTYITEESINKRINPVFTGDGKFYAVDLMKLNDMELLTMIDKIQADIINRRIRALHDGSDILSILEEMSVVSGRNIYTNSITNKYSLSNHYIVIFSNNYEGELVGSTSIDEFSITINPRDVFINRTTLSNELDTGMLQSLDYKAMDYGNHKGYTQEEVEAIINSRGICGKNIAIIRDEGSNSHKEMITAFAVIGANPIDFTINELLTDDDIIEKFMDCDGYVIVGGFSYGDIMGSGRATAEIIRHSPRLIKAFDSIYHNSNKFILGVCNGAQIMCELGWFGGTRLLKNISNRFECRYLPVDIENEKRGIWIAHGEGRFSDVPSNVNIIGKYISNEYPLNPNGSQHNIFGISRGKHIALMPHPERTIFKWQCEHAGSIIYKYTPWIMFFLDLFL